MSHVIAARIMGSKQLRHAQSHVGLSNDMGMIVKVNFQNLTFYYLKFFLFVHYDFFFFLEALRIVLSVSSSVFFLIWLTFVRLIPYASPHLLFASFVNDVLHLYVLPPPVVFCM